MDDWPAQLINMLPQGAIYLGVVFFVTFFESLPLIGLLLPGSTLVVLAGFLAFHGKSTLLLVISVATAGALLGDLVSYWLGTRYGSKLIRLKSFRKHRRLFKKSVQFFVNHGGKSIFFARFLGPIRGITPFVAGLSGMPRRSFSIYALISAILWGISYPGLGYWGGQSWQYAQSLSTRFGLGIVVLLAAVIIHHWVRKNIRP